MNMSIVLIFVFTAEAGIRYYAVTGFQTCALLIAGKPGYGGRLIQHIAFKEIARKIQESTDLICSGFFNKFIQACLPPSETFSSLPRRFKVYQRQ